MRPPTLSANGISPGVIEALCAATGAVFEATKQIGKSQQVRINFAKTDDGFTPFIVIDAASPVEQHSEKPLELKIRTTSIDIFPLLQCILVFIRARRPVTQWLHDNILSCMHEAILNALIHGNLDQKSHYDNKKSLFDHFEGVQQILIRRKEPETIAMTLDFSGENIAISIRDRGKGFSKDAMVIPGESALYGRGMAIIRECCDDVDITDEGRTITMRFTSNMFQKNATLSILKSHILVVDDVAVNRAIIKEILRRKGFTNITLAVDGEDAFKKTQELKPDLVVLDLILPKMDGYEYCRRIRETPEFQDLPIVVQTILSREEQRSKAFACGASDLVTKPINPYELVARITLHLERQELLHDLKNYQQRMQADLEEARTMQQSIMPNGRLLGHLKTKYGTDIHSLFQSSSEIGGDIWGIRTISNDAYAVYAVDFSGHGISAALNAFRLQALLQGMSTTNMEDPAAVLNALNKKLLKLLAVEQFATMFYAVFDTKKKTLNYAAAGAPAPALIHKGKKIDWIDGTGMPLGVTPKATYVSHTLPFNEESCILIYSDSMIESTNSEGLTFTPEMLEKCLPAKTPGAFFQDLIERFTAHCDEGIQDDLTIVLLSHKKLKTTH